MIERQLSCEQQHQNVDMLNMC